MTIHSALRRDAFNLEHGPNEQQHDANQRPVLQIVVESHESLLKG